MKIIEIINSLKNTDITDVINCVVGIIGLIMSIIAIVISICTARRQYKIDLFNKRMSYYHTCRLIITGCCLVGKEEQVEENLKKQGLELVYYDSDGAKFLFNKKTSKFISEIFSKWIAHSHASSFVKNYNDNKAQKELYEGYKKECEENRAFFKLAREQLAKNFKKYLKMI